MSHLPPGWDLVSLNDLQADEPRAITDGPFGSSLTSAHYTKHGPRVVRLQKIGDGRFVDAHAHISHQHFESLRAHEVLAGDLLVASLGDDPPRACLAPSTLGPAIVKADCIRARLAPSVDPRWVLYALQTPAVRKWASEKMYGVGRPRLGLKTIRAISIPLPPLDEQRRIVEILEDHLSHLDAAERTVAAAARRLELWGLSSLWHETHDHQGSASRLAEVAEVRLGRQRSPLNHSGPRMRPYLRAANVHWDRLRLDDVKEMHFSSSEESGLALQEGDILVVEASGSRREVGKSAVYRGEVPGACFQNTLLRVRVSGANPDFIQKYLLAEAWAGRLAKESRGVGIHHIGRARLAALPVALPSIEAQRDSVVRASSALEALERARESLAAHHVRADKLRRSLLTAAFSGRLTR